MVAAAISLSRWKFPSSRSRASLRSKACGLATRILSSAATSSIPGWAVVRVFGGLERRASTCAPITTGCAPWSARPTRNVIGSYPPHLVLRAMLRPPRL